MTIEDKEKELVAEVKFFNKTMEWWFKEYNKAEKQFIEVENGDFSTISDTDVETLIAKLSYLSGKARTEQKAMTDLQKKIYKHYLAKDLLIIQGEEPKRQRKKFKS